MSKPTICSVKPKYFYRLSHFNLLIFYLTEEHSIGLMFLSSILIRIMATKVMTSCKNWPIITISAFRVHKLLMSTISLMLIMTLSSKLWCIRPMPEVSNHFNPINRQISRFSKIFQHKVFFITKIYQLFWN